MNTIYQVIKKPLTYQQKPSRIRLTDFEVLSVDLQNNHILHVLSIHQKKKRGLTREKISDAHCSICTRDDSSNNQYVPPRMG